jgi:hypothetical protein
MTYLGFPVRMKQDVQKVIRQWGLISVLVLLGVGLLLALRFSRKPFTLMLVENSKRGTGTFRADVES